jgi:tetratricopeptide (TPR) repeat protein
VLGLLTALVDQSLVEAQKGPAGARYQLLETVRHYGLEKLGEAAEEDVVRSRHAQYFLDLAEQAEREINTPHRGRWLDRLEAEHDNLRTVLAAATATTAGDAGPRLAGALTWFWWWRGYIAEGRRWLESMAASSPEVPPAVTAKVLSGAGLLAWAQGADVAAHRCLQRSVDLWRQLDDPAQLAQALRLLGGNHELRGELDLARALVEESVALYRSAGDRFGEALFLARLGVTAVSQRDYSGAQAALDASVRICRETGDNWVLAIALRHRGIGALRAGDVARASAALRELLELLAGPPRPTAHHPGPGDACHGARVQRRSLPGGPAVRRTGGAAREPRALRDLSRRRRTRGGGRPGRPRRTSLRRAVVAGSGADPRGGRRAGARRARPRATGRVDRARSGGAGPGGAGPDQRPDRGPAVPRLPHRELAPHRRLPRARRALAHRCGPVRLEHGLDHRAVGPIGSGTGSSHGARHTPRPPL